MIRHAFKAFSALLIFGCALPLISQDSHYWDTKYGTESTLLGGAVVGSHLDISSTFYNPGALGITENPAFLITGWQYNLTAINFASAAGSDNDLNSVRFSPAPDYVAGLVPSAAKSSKFAYSMLSRYQFQERLFARDRFRKDVLHSPGEEWFQGEYYVDQDLVENWFGLTWSSRIAKSIGFGITNFLAFRSQKFRSSIHNQAVTDANTAALTSIIRQFNFYSYRLLWKIGVAADFSPLKLGFSLTTPGINLYGKGTSYTNHTIIGQAIQDYGDQDYLRAREVKDQAITFKSPLSVAFGASFRFNKTTLHTSVEWFDNVDTYQILSAPQQLPGLGDIAFTTDVVQSLKSVTNFGVGVQRTFSERLEFYASVITDLSATNLTDSDISITTWDIHHVMAGALFRLWRSEITIGVGYAFGSDDVKQKVDFSTAHENNLLLGERSRQTSHYNQMTVLVGFSIFPKELFERTLPFFNN
jgi:hypothetical protein